MHGKSPKGYCLFGLGLLGLVFTQPVFAAQADGPAPPLELLADTPLPDPHIYKEAGYWYIFGTGLHFFMGRTLDRAAMVTGRLELDYGPGEGPYRIWAFSVYKDAQGSYHGYATVHFGKFVTAVAHFLPQEGETWRDGAPITKWKLDRLLVGDRTGEGVVAYDQNLVEDTDGTLYLVYNAAPRLHTDVHIMAQRMLNPSAPDPSFTPRAILSPQGYRSEDRNPGYIQIVEATHIADVSGKHVLVYSVGDFALYEGKKSNYKIGVAYSDRLIPPEGETYQKVLIPDPDNVWGNSGKNAEVCYLLQSQIERWPNYCGDWLQGPGIGNIVSEAGRYWLVFHGYPPDKTQDPGFARYIWKAPLEIQISPDRPMQEWIRVCLPQRAASAVGKPLARVNGGR